MKKFALFKPQNITSFEGSSPPDIFVGRIGYPYIYTGILSPPEIGEDTYKLSSPEEWFKQQLSVEEVLQTRSKLIYSRFKNSIKPSTNKLSEVMQEVAMTHKPCDVEFTLHKQPKQHLETSLITAPLGNTAPLEKARLTSNPKIHTKVEYFVNDPYVKAKDALQELYKKELSITNLNKMLSAGLFGIKSQRKLVPTKWSITAVDDMLSKEQLKAIKTFPLMNDITVFSSYYIGNLYVIVLLPQPWSFEVIEIKIPEMKFWQDYETIFPRKYYADDVTGAYYANRLAVTEYLTKIKRQATVLVLRQIDPSYTAPLGVGHLRENSRNALKQQGTKVKDAKELKEIVQSILSVPPEMFLDKSKLLSIKQEQKTLLSFK